MSRTITVSVKIPKDIYAELSLRIPEGERSNFIREAIIERLKMTPRPNKIVKLEERVRKVENDLSAIKNALADLELLTYKNGEINPHRFCIDEIDHSIIDYLLHYKNATTTELASELKVNRWLILNRLKRISGYSKKELGKPIVKYIAREKTGKKKAWWLNNETVTS